MSIIKFQPNVPVVLRLTRETPAKAASQFDGADQWQWKAKNADGEPCVFYAYAPLHDKLNEFVTQNNITDPIEICKRTLAGGKSQWVIQKASTGAPKESAPAATAPAGRVETEPVKDSQAVRKINHLFIQCYLEMYTAMKHLNGNALAGDQLRSAATSVFIACTQRGFTANADRIRELMNELPKRAVTNPETPQKGETYYEPDESYTPASDDVPQPPPPPATTATPSTMPPKISEMKLNGLMAAARTKGVSPETLISTLNKALNLRLAKLEDIPERHFPAACTILAKLKIE